MIFSSAVFLFAFLPISVIGNFLIKNEYRNFWLILCSLFFYAWAQPKYIWLIIGMILINYFSALIIEREKDAKLIFILTLLLNLSGLLYYKYFNFIIETINSIFQSNIRVLDIILPIGISFYTFKGISYVADVYTKRIHAEKSIINFSVYILMFPQIMSGPIDPYEGISTSLKNRQVTVEYIHEGIKRFVFGLAQKAIIANSLGAIVDDIWTKEAGSLSWKLAWFGSIAYSLQIFFDFAGYSNMAIGIGKMLGFSFSENFDLPYMSKNITEFWRRWHITLGEWFKKYVYIPLGGNRRSMVRGYINIGIVFLLTGIWHGASWTFIIWGMLHGACRLFEKFAKDKIRVKKQNLLFSALKHFYCLFIVNIGWVIFRAPDLKNAVNYIKAMFGMSDALKCGISVLEYMDRWNILIILIGILFSTPVPRKAVQIIKKRINHNFYAVAKDLCLLMLLNISVVEVVTNTYQTFIYFQF